jgi:hypothetical protein
MVSPGLPALPAGGDGAKTAVAGRGDDARGDARRRHGDGHVYI